MKENTAQTILDVAQELFCSRGYSAFSYADISERVGIRKASIHYHFPSKEDLTRDLVRRYRHNFQQTLRAIEQKTDNPPEQLTQFCQIYRDKLDPKRVCLYGMLLANYIILPETVQTEVSAFFSDAQQWLAKILQQGKEKGHFSPSLTPTKEASTILATVHGAQLLARASEHCKVMFDSIVEQLLEGLTVDN
jgi:TetR/AcrR family transcriptional repressor of nem operon